MLTQGTRYHSVSSIVSYHYAIESEENLSFLIYLLLHLPAANKISKLPQPAADIISKLPQPAANIILKLPQPAANRHFLTYK